VENSLNFSLTIVAQDSVSAINAAFRGVLAGVGEMVECLLIDRNAGERQRVMGLLAGMGMTLTERSAASDGLRYCNDNAPDLVLLAAERSEVTSGDFLRRMRKSAAGRKPVVILYGKSPAPDEISQSILEGAADFILQPFDRDLLHFKLKQAGIL
jgi:two-component system, chemotaxis family, chemotaxis protein CheY